MRDETIPEQLRRVDDLIDEAISIIGYVREETHYKPDGRFARAEAHARAAQREIRRELGLTEHPVATAADCSFGVLLALPLARP
jgi:hypothetical protein